MNKVLESYVKYLLENTALPMHSNLRTKKEKRINNVVSGVIPLAGAAHAYSMTKSKSAALPYVLAGAVGFAVAQLIIHYTDNCRKMAKAGNTSQQRKVMYYGCQVKACKQIVAAYKSAQSKTKDDSLRKRLEAPLKIWNARLEEKQSLLRDALRSK